MLKYLQNLEEDTSIHIQMCIEMEPSCTLEFTDQLISFFLDQLIPYAHSKSISKDTVLRYIAVCYDVCHQAIMYEDMASFTGPIVYARYSRRKNSNFMRITH